MAHSVQQMGCRSHLNSSLGIGRPHQIEEQHQRIWTILGCVGIIMFLLLQDDSVLALVSPAMYE